jgi:hypothetical protein
VAIAAALQQSVLVDSIVRDIPVPDAGELIEGGLKLMLNMEKTHITHVNDGFVFLGHRIIRKRGPRGRMRPVMSLLL